MTTKRERDRQTDRQTGRQTDRQTDRQTETDRQRETETDRESSWDVARARKGLTYRISHPQTSQPFLVLATHSCMKWQNCCPGKSSLHEVSISASTATGFPPWTESRRRQPRSDVSLCDRRHAPALCPLAQMQRCSGDVNPLAALLPNRNYDVLFKHANVITGSLFCKLFVGYRSEPEQTRSWFKQKVIRDKVGLNKKLFATN